MNIESGEIILKDEKDLSDLIKLFKKAINTQTLNDNSTKFLIKGLDEIEITCKKLYKEVNSISDIKKKSDRYDLCLELMTKAQIIKLNERI